MTVRSFGLPLFVFAGLLATTALADGQHHARFACHDDVMKFCGDVKVSQGRAGIQACLKTHETELSQSCQAQRAKIKERIEAFKTACGHDVETFCGGTASAEEPKFRAVRECLRTHKAELSDSCKSFRTQMHNRFGHPGGEQATPAAAPTE